MFHLFHHLNDDPVFMQVSPLYQLIGSPRAHVRPLVLSGMLDAGWPIDVNEMDPVRHRSLLLSYLGTFAEWGNGYRVNEPVDADHLNAEELTAVAIEHHGDPFAVAHALLDRGADPWVKDTDGRDALDQAFSLQWSALLPRLLDDPRAPSVQGLSQRRQQVLSHRESATATHPGTPFTHLGAAMPWLHASAAKGRVSMIAMLLDRGMDVDQRDAFGRTPLFYATFDATVQLLLERGADPSIQDQFGERPDAVWTHLQMNSEQLGRMNSRFTKHLRAAFHDRPEHMNDEQRPMLFRLATTATATNFSKFFRDHGFAPDETTTLHGQRVPLLAWVNEHNLIGPTLERSPAIANFLLGKSSISTLEHETLTGVPDVVPAWLFAHGIPTNNAVAAQKAAEAAMGKVFGWHEPQGFERSLDRLLAILQHLTRPHDAQVFTDDAGIAAWQQRVNMGTVCSGVAFALSHALSTELTGAGLSFPLEDHQEEAARDVLTWARRTDAAGISVAWRWAAIASLNDVQATPGNLKGARPTPGMYNLVQSMLGGPQGQGQALVPLDPVGVLVVLDVLSHTSNMVTLARTSSPWGRGPFVGALYHAVVNQGVIVDTTASGFDACLARLRKVEPVVVQHLEQWILHQPFNADSGAAPLTNLSDPRPRARL